jgi:hypothetical protein
MIDREFAPQQFANEFDPRGEASEYELLYPRRPTVAGASPSRCPPDSSYTLRGYPPHETNWLYLPRSQRAKLKFIVGEIERRLSREQSIVVQIVGHADFDPRPGINRAQISYDRAESIQSSLATALAPLARRITWSILGRGSRLPAVPNPRTEVERKCNRRATIRLISRTRRREAALDHEPFEIEQEGSLYGCTPCLWGRQICRKPIVADDGRCRYIALDTWYCWC